MLKMGVGYAERQRGTQWWGKGVLLLLAGPAYGSIKSEALKKRNQY